MIEIIGAVAIVVIWLAFGRGISPIVDGCISGRGSPTPVDPMLIQFDRAGLSSGFTLGQRIWPLSWPNLPGPVQIKIAADGQGRLVISTDDRAFTLGPIQKMWDDPAKPQYQFCSEPGDVVSFTQEIGRLPWPTPFEFNILGGSTPKWKRFVYDRLRWAKKSGAVLEIVWRNEEWFYRGSGWADTYNNRLIRLRIRPDSIGNQH